MAQYTIEQRIFLYETYLKYSSARRCRREFQLRYAGVRIPSRSTIHGLVNKVKRTGSFMNTKYFRKRSVLTEEKLEEVGARLEDSSQKPLRLVGQEFGISKTSAFRAMKLLKLKPYKGDLDFSDSGATSADGNEASDGAGPAEGHAEAGFSQEVFETCDISDVKVKVEQTDDYSSEPETKRSRLEEYHDESKMEEALSILRDLKEVYSAFQTAEESKDRFTVYGQHVANKLRGYSEKTSAIVEHAINNILFEADMGNYDGIHTALPSHDDSAQ